MKKLLLVLLLVGLIFSLLACGKEENNSNDPANQQEPNNDDGSGDKEPIGEDPQIVGKNDYYNELNFVDSSKTVTKTKLVTYDGPSYLNESDVYDVDVNGHNLFVYSTRVNNERQFSWTTPQTKTQFVTFDFEGVVKVKVIANKQTNIKSAKVSPLVYGISPQIEGNVVTFTLEYSGNYVLELNDDSTTALQIFANGIEEDPITKEDADKDPNIYYIGPGVYKADAIPVADNATIYLAGGAYVYGQIRAEGLKNLTIRGRGIFSGEIYFRRNEAEYTLPIEIRSSENVKIEDIIFIDPAGWTITLFNSKDVEINNIKIITARQNGDGISVQSCNNVSVNGGYVRTWDDALVVKNTGNKPTSNITFDNVVVWTDLAQSMEVGYEAFGETMENITFKNITVVHNFHKAVISLHNADDAKISGVTYQNITVEDCQTLGDNQKDGENDFLIDLDVLYNLDWSTSTNIQGTVKNVVIDNVKVYKIASTVISRINGFSNTATIDGVRISDIEIAGKLISSLEDLKLVTNQYASNISYEKKASSVLGAIINLPYKAEVENEDINYTSNENISQSGMIVPDFARSKGDIPYIGVPDNNSYTAEATHGVGSKTTTPADDGSGDWTKEESSASYAVDKDPTTSWISKELKGEENEFTALTIDFGGKLLNVGVIRLYGNFDNDFYFTYSFQVWGKKLKTDGTINDKYVRLVGLKEYALSPISNNIIDINITTQEYAGIQLRFYYNDDPSGVLSYEIAEVEFYAPSLSYGASIVSATEHNDVYTVDKIVDGDATGTSYYESKSLPATIIIDLGNVYNVNTIVFALPPSIKWDARSQEIMISYSDSNNSYSDSMQFTTLISRTKYLFDPLTGNRNVISVDNVNMRFLKIVIYSNDTKGGYNAQLSEVSVYGE